MTIGGLIIPAPLLWIFGAALLLACLAGLLAGLVRGDPVRPDQERERTQSPVWARPGDVAKLLIEGPTAGRLTLGFLDGRRVANPARRSKLVLAPSGEGKTPRCVVPDVLDHVGPAVVGSVKADVLHLTHASRGESGDVWVFDPTGSTGMPSCCWPFLEEITTYQDALKTASWISDSSKVDKRGLENAEFWDTLGLKLIAPLLYLAAHSGSSITTVTRWVEYQAEREVNDGLRHIADQPGAQDALAAWAAVCSKPDSTKGSVFGTADF